jgi:hypothetical protein
MRAVLKDDERGFMPWTVQPRPGRNPARLAPSWQVIPIISTSLRFWILNSHTDSQRKLRDAEAAPGRR